MSQATIQSASWIVDVVVYGVGLAVYMYIQVRVLDYNTATGVLGRKEMLGLLEWARCKTLV
jgi:hypothetical protein